MERVIQVGDLAQTEGLHGKDKRDAGAIGVN